SFAREVFGGCRTWFWFRGINGPGMQLNNIVCIGHSDPLLSRQRGRSFGGHLPQLSAAIVCQQVAALRRQTLANHPVRNHYFMPGIRFGACAPARLLAIEWREER